MYLANEQVNLVNGAWTLVELDTISAGFADGIEDTVAHVIAPGVAGFYHLIGQVTFNSVIADKRYQVRLVHNISGSVVYRPAHASNVFLLSVPINAHVYLPAAGEIRMDARSDSGDNTVDLQENEVYTFLSVQRVR